MYWWRRVSGCHRLICCQLCCSRLWTSLHRLSRTWQTCHSENVGFQQPLRQLGTASVEEAQSGQGTDVQLPADIEPHDSFQGDRAPGAGQTEAPPVCITELCASTVGVLAQSFSRDSATARHEQCVCGCRWEEGYCAGWSWTFSNLRYHQPWRPHQPSGKPAWRWQRYFQLAALIPHRQAAACETRKLARGKCS